MFLYGVFKLLICPSWSIGRCNLGARTMKNFYLEGVEGSKIKDLVRFVIFNQCFNPPSQPQSLKSLGKLKCLRVTIFIYGLRKKRKCVSLMLKLLLRKDGVPEQ